MNKFKQQKINTKFKRKLRNHIFKTDYFPPYTYIVCEGEKTEPNYINDFVKEINQKYGEFSQQKRVKVVGIGRNTQSLLEYARKHVNIDMPNAEYVWLVYDKDDFPIDNFDNTQYSAETKNNTRKYKVAWSNECFELWLVLHYQEMDSDIGREQYIKLLEKYIPNYKKNMKGVYQVVKENTSIAIARAKKQYKNYDNETPPSKRCPATRIYELIETLIHYI